MNTATIVCNEACDASDDIKTLIAECGHHCRGEALSVQTIKEVDENERY
jgi:hypothetical protein